MKISAAKFTWRILCYTNLGNNNSNTWNSLPSGEEFDNWRSQIAGATYISKSQPEEQRPNRSGEDEEWGKSPLKWKKHPRLYLGLRGGSDQLPWTNSLMEVPTSKVTNAYMNHLRCTKRQTISQGTIWDPWLFSRKLTKKTNCFVRALN